MLTLRCNGPCCGKPVFNKTLTSSEMLAFFAALTLCLIGIEPVQYRQGCRSSKTRTHPHIASDGELDAKFQLSINVPTRPLLAQPLALP